MIVVSDTSPLCNLTLVNHLWWLREIYGFVIIPDVVAHELAAASDLTIQNIFTLTGLTQNPWSNNVGWACLKAHPTCGVSA